MKSQRLARGAYLALLGWQPLWLAVLPPPLGPRSLVLAAFATLPLLIPLAGVLAGRMRAMTWGGFLAVPYFVIGVTEAWSNPGMRLPALAETFFSAAYILTLAHHAAELRRRGT